LIIAEKTETTLSEDEEEKMWADFERMKTASTDAATEEETRTTPGTTRTTTETTTSISKDYWWQGMPTSKFIRKSKRCGRSSLQGRVHIVGVIFSLFRYLLVFGSVEIFGGAQQDEHVYKKNHVPFHQKHAQDPETVIEYIRLQLTYALFCISYCMLFNKSLLRSLRVVPIFQKYSQTKPQ
jgi:hypothetical protein